MCECISLLNQSGNEDSAGVEVSGAAGKLLWHAAKENPTQQETDLRGNWAQTQRSGESNLKAYQSIYDFPFSRSLADSCFSLPSLQLLVLKYVQNKDVFMRYHKAHLTRRLILDISADSEIEENMVEWLRVSSAFLELSAAES